MSPGLVLFYLKWTRLISHEETTEIQSNLNKSPKPCQKSPGHMTHAVFLLCYMGTNKNNVSPNVTFTYNVHEKGINDLCQNITYLTITFGNKL
jgi:hypothetical protein